MKVGSIPRCNRLQNQGGFTLLEMLIAITLLAMLSVMLLGGMRLGGRVWERSVKEIDQTDETRIARDFIRAALAGAYPQLDKSDPTHPVIGFIGEATSLRFLAPMPQALGSAGFAQMSLYVEEAGDTRRLILGLRPELAFEDAKSPSPSVLLSKMQTVEFSYFGAEEAGKAPVWQDHWKSAIALPKLIRLRVTFAEGDTRPWPDLVVATRIQVGADCSYDPAIKACKGR
jgi:general secretion pathway protein J